MNEPIIRRLKSHDIHQGFLRTLDSLRQTSNINADEANKIFEKIDSNPDHVIIIAEIDKKIIGSVTILFEQKFIHGGGVVGHIEDVVVDKEFQGQDIGKKIVKYALEFAQKCGCYKTILNCANNVIPFYKKLGFKQSGYELRFDHFDV